VKVKHRYILVEASEELNESFKDDIRKELILCIGSIDYHLVNPRLIGFDGKEFIIKCSLEGFGKLVVALSMIKNLNNRDISFYTLKTSGTIKSLTSSG
jgi:RNase P/RNase MRP subunit POP5